VGTPGTTPDPLRINKIIGRLDFGIVRGDCNGISCVLPDTDGGFLGTSFAYSSASQIEFCVIPTSLLP
jgi:hypothetical protein